MREEPPAPDPVPGDLASAAAHANPAVLADGTRAAFGKRLVLRVIRLYTAGQVAFNHAVVRILGALEARVRELRRSQIDALERERNATQALAGLGRRLADVEAFVLRLGANAGELAQRVDRITPATAEQMFVPGAHAVFEQQFRGTREEILERQRIYVPLMEKAARREARGARFLDLGCGRGELLELARGAGLAATGIESDAALAEACRTRGLDAQAADLFDALWAEKEESLAGVTAIQVVEHLPWAAVRVLVDLSFQRIRPGGCLILETINPASAYAMRTFYLDPTHRQPVPRDMAQFLLAQAGFQDIETRWLNPVDEPGLAKAVEGDEKLRGLADLLFGFRDYALIGWRP